MGTEVDLKEKRHTTTVTTEVNVREALTRAPEGTLTHEEERLLRMRRGVPLESVEKLGLKGQAFAETRAKLAMIEKMALEALQERAQDKTARAPAAKPANPQAHNPAKAHIISRLRRETPRD